MKNILSYQEWLNEEAFAQVGVAPEGNLGGTIGNPTPPTATSTGSGDLWPSLGEPSSLAPLSKRKKRKKQKFSNKEKALLKNTLQESLRDVQIKKEQDFELIVSSFDENVTDEQWNKKFENYYIEIVPSRKTKELREKFDGKWEWTFRSFEYADDTDEISEKDQDKILSLEDNGWETFWQGDDDGMFSILFYRKEKSLTKYSSLAKKLMLENLSLSGSVLAKLASLLSPEDYREIENKIKGRITGSKFGLS